MRKILIVSTFFIVLGLIFHTSGLSGSVHAQQTTPQPTGIVTHGIRVVSDNPVLKARGVAQSIEKVFSSAINRAALILTKLQKKIDQASSSGRDMTEANKLMVDAQNKLRDVRVKLSITDDHLGRANNRADFEAIRVSFKEMVADLQGVREDASKIITILRKLPTTPS
ncbi:MAG: hypothetical protein M1142_05440 [Patescibacteria group bacterium]|nr:hypothetical protein [Patescibacteria group bacterium]